MAVALATALRDRLLDPNVYGQFDFYFSDSGIQELGWLSMYRPAQPCPRLLDNVRRAIVELRIHTNSVGSEQGSTDGYLHGECCGDTAWRDGDKGIRSEFLGIADTEWGLGPLGFNGQQWVLMKDVMNRMNAQRVQAISLIESTRLKANLDRYLKLSNINKHAGLGYNLTPLRRVVEIYDDLTHLDAGDHITAQPLTLDWVLRKIPGGSPNTARAITYLDCQFWIDISTLPLGGPPAAEIITIPDPEDILELVEGLRGLKLHVGAMEYVPGISDGHITKGEGYKVVHRDALSAAMVNAHLVAPYRHYVARVIRHALANHTLRVFELTGTKAAQNFEDFFSPVGAVNLPGMPNGLTVLKLKNLTISNMLRFRAALVTLESLTTLHLVNLQGGEVEAGVVPPIHWDNIMSLFELPPANAPPEIVPRFPALRELNVDNLMEGIRVPNYHLSPRPYVLHYSPWDPGARQSVGWVQVLGASIPEPFVSGSPIHGRVQTRFGGMTGGMIAETPAVPYNPGAQGGPGNDPVRATREAPAKPRRPRYWFH